MPTISVFHVNNYRVHFPHIFFVPSRKYSLLLKLSAFIVFVTCRDPNLWMVKCRIGEEKATCLLLMRKFLAFQNTNEPLQIKSVIAPEGVKGYIYIESYKQTHVKAAIDNVGTLRMGIWKQQV